MYNIRLWSATLLPTAGRGRAALHSLQQGYNQKGCYLQLLCVLSTMPYEFVAVKVRAGSVRARHSSDIAGCVAHYLSVIPHACSLPASIALCSPTALLMPFSLVCQPPLPHPVAEKEGDLAMTKCVIGKRSRQAIGCDHTVLS